MNGTKLKQQNAGTKAWDVIKGNPIAVILVLAAIVVGCVVDNFFSWGNLSNLLSNTAVRFLIALGVSGCLITKGTDLSAGRQVGLAACIAGVLCQRGDYTGRMWKSVPEMNIFLVLLIVLAIGFVVGLVNGLIIAKLHVPPFIATLGTQTIIYGIALVLTVPSANVADVERFRDLIAHETLATSFEVKEGAELGVEVVKA